MDGDRLDFIADWEVESCAAEGCQVCGGEDACEEHDVCGETIDHDLVTIYEDEDGRQSECARCGAELWEEIDE